mmetsp:Transcript_2120/g.3747  ORF Transcript_2120/g.3747 Transcript_2120/m.3747 type:complete len:468 (+) Transcript_2120:35-1438(+)
MESQCVVSLLLFSFAICFVAAWHPYTRRVAQQRRHDCPKQNSSEQLSDFKRRTAPISTENAEKWKLWPNLISDQDFKNGEGEVMYGYEEGMSAIWENQHPQNCSQAKFLVSMGWEAGFGSETHMLGQGLGLALQLGRVYIMLPNKLNTVNRYQVDNRYCKEQTTPNSNSSLECYYEPWSSCTLTDVFSDVTMEKFLRESKLAHTMSTRNLAQLDPHDEALVLKSRILFVAHTPNYFDFVPKIFQSLLECSPFHPTKYRYWWRSVSATYLLRPNAATRALIQKHRLEDPTLQFDPNKEQCVSVYIRRGDKHLEMKLIKNETVFFETAKQLWQNLPNHDQQKQPVMFVGSEDPEVIDSALTWGVENNWRILYSNLFDRRSVSAYLNATEQAAHRVSGTFKTDEWEYFSMILNLDSHIQCSAFVCTMRSNYCRLIDELRATVGGKVNRQYADYTLQPPAVDSPKSSIDWR